MCTCSCEITKLQSGPSSYNEEALHLSKRGVVGLGPSAGATLRAFGAAGPLSSLQRSLFSSGSMWFQRRTSSTTYQSWVQMSECSCCSHQNGCESRRRAARGQVLAEVFDFSCWHFSSLFGFLSGGLSIHITFSTSAVICALGDNVGDRNRVTG